MKIHFWNTNFLHCPWSLVVSLSFPSCSSPSVIFLIWRSISGTLTSCIVLEVSLYLSLSLFPFLLVSFWNHSDMKIHLWTTDLPHGPWSLVVISLFPFLLVSFCNLSDMKVHLWNTDLLHYPWSLVVPLSFLSCSSPPVNLSDMKVHLYNTDLLHCPWSLVVSLSSPSCSTPSVIFRIWSSFSEHWSLAWSLKSCCISLSILCTTSKYYLFRNETFTESSDL